MDWEVLPLLPPNSPALVLFDFHLFGSLENCLHRNIFQKNEEVKEYVKK